MKKIILSVATLTVLVTSCGKKEELKDERIYDIAVTMEKTDFVNIESTRKQYNAHGGEYFSSVDSITQYGAGYVRKIEDSLKGYNVDIYLSAFIREAMAPLEGGIAVAIFAPSGIKDWRVIQPKLTDFKAGEWNPILDTIKYQSSLLTEKDTEIKIFSIKPKGADMLDIDDIKIKYKFYK